MQSAADFTDRLMVQGVYADPEKETVGAFRVEDWSMSRWGGKPGGFAIIDWSMRSPVAGRPYLILYDGRPVVREYQAHPPAWVARYSSDDGSWPDIMPSSQIKVVATVLTFHNPTF